MNEERNLIKPDLKNRIVSYETHEVKTCNSWHRPTLTLISIKRTLNGGGSNNDGSTGSITGDGMTT